MTYFSPILRCARLLLLAGALFLLIGPARATASFVGGGMIKRNTSVFPMRNRPADLGLWAKAGHNVANALPYTNLVSRTHQRLQQRVGAAAAIRFSGADFANMARPGKSEAMYIAGNDDFTAQMDIGRADDENAQTWTIPATLIDELDEFIQRDFVLPNAIPKSIRLPNATHATRLKAQDGSYVGYRQYQLDNDEVEDLGFGIDLADGEDYEVEFPTDGATFLAVPLELGSSYHSNELMDEPGDEDQKIETNSEINFDGFGTLRTPDGDHPALRYTATTTLSYSKPTGQPTEINQVGWITKEGHWFVATYADHDESTGKATLSDISYTRIVATSSLR